MSWLPEIFSHMKIVELIHENNTDLYDETVLCDSALLAMCTCRYMEQSIIGSKLSDFHQMCF